MNFLENFNAETLVLAFGSICFIALLFNWHSNDHVKFDIKTALMNDGKFSLSKFGQLVAMLVSTWVIIYETRHGKLTEWLFAGYMFAWSGANIASKFIERSSPTTNSLNKSTDQEIVQTKKPDYRDFRSNQN